MGLQDRDYFQDHQRQSGWGGERYERRGLPHLPRTIVGWLLLVNIAVYLFDNFTSGSFASTYGDGARFIDWLSLPADQIFRPLGWYRFLTCGFAHSPQPAHIICNMLILFFFGPAMERRYGGSSFLLVYLAMVVLSAMFWAAGMGFAAETVRGPDGNIYQVMNQICGASGAVTGVVILFALNYPKQRAYWFIIPMPMWLLATLMLVADMSGMLGHPLVTSGNGLRNIAFSAHIGGAIVAVLWWRFCAGRSWYETLVDRLTPARWRWQRMRTTRVPRTGASREFTGNRDFTGSVGSSRTWNSGGSDGDGKNGKGKSGSVPESLDAEVDRILAKYSDQGPDSLTESEKRTLQRASEIYRKNRS
ncbi:MAG: rhomboid family intramembrane serine protease [Planctomycetia bacterium]|nr:rhomboid family intramembrane serine protease [Planctomycetia bacterium]